MHTRYAPVRRSPSASIATRHAAPRLACIKPAASVHPEPGSNSSLYYNSTLNVSVPGLRFLYSKLRLRFVCLTAYPYLVSLLLLSIAFCRYCFVYSISMNSFTGLLRSSDLPLNFRPVAPPSGSPLRRPLRSPRGETGCKSTTFFLSTKLFLKKVFNSHHRHPYKRLCPLHSFSMHLMEGHTRVSLLKGSTI